MHLCEPCASSRDWVNDPVVQTKIALNLQQSDPNRKAVCGTCRAAIRNPLFQLCARCAESAKLCQHCSKSTISAEERAAIERAAARDEELVDLFSLSVKTYGLTASRDLFREMHAEFGAETVATLVALDHRDIDATLDRPQDHARKRRPMWKILLGSNVYRSRFCQVCSAIPKRAPGIVKADLCGHWTTARSPAYCPVCASDALACESCGDPTE